jgi:hydroxyacylglutathione hydrolase
VVEVADGAWVRTSVRGTTTTTIVDLGGGRCLLVDPAVERSDLVEIAVLVRSLGLEIVLGWSTHPHWDHVLWGPELGLDVPRLATAANAELCGSEHAALAAYLGAECAGHEVELCGRMTGLEPDDERWPAECSVVEHSAHAPGHGALWLAERELLIAGDMVSEIEIPTLDLEAADPLGDYQAALDRYDAIALRASVFVPGHGAPGDRDELLRRLALDRAYLADLVAGRPTDDPRRAVAWLQEAHESHVEWYRAHAAGDGS